MKLVVTEKNDAAQKIADLLSVKKPKADKGVLDAGVPLRGRRRRSG